MLCPGGAAQIAAMPLLCCSVDSYCGSRPCYAFRCHALAKLVGAMPLRCCAVLSYSSAMHHTAMPRPSCSSLSYATAELIPALLLLWISAPCVLCLSSAIPSSSMLLLCGRSVASHCPAVLCHSNSIPGFSIAMQVNSRPCLCGARLRYAFARLCIPMPRPICSSLSYAIAKLSPALP